MSRRGVAPLVILATVVTLYLGVPLAAFVVRLATAPQRGFRSPGLFPALWVSLSAATISLALVTIFGVPLAYLLARSTGRIATVVGVIVQAPLALPPIMAGIVLVYLVGPYTIVGRAFGGRLTESMFGVVIAMTFCSAPFLIVAARASFASVDQGQLDVAATLGHGEVSRFWHVAVPVAGAGIRAGMLLAWLRAFAEYGAVIILAYNPASLPVYTYNQFSGVGLPTTLAPTALALGAAAVAVALSRATLTRSAPAPPPAPTAMTSAPSSSSSLFNASTRTGTAAPVPSSPVRFQLDHRLGSFHLVVDHESNANHLAVVGPSGSGKSALLRCVAGLYGRGPGPVWYGDDPVRDVAVERRRVGYVAQGFSLYPHLSVWRHLMFARGATPELAQYWMSHLRLDALADRTPDELSGGQRQRVGLAQVLCSSPQVLLLDEPFSALDEPVRRELRGELRRLQHETGLATVLVTHDPEEAAFLSDELIVLSCGRVLQTGTSRDVFSRPASPDVARLLGIANLHRATVVASFQIAVGDAVVSVGERVPAPQGTDVVWSVRPEDVAVVAVSDVASAVGGEFFYGTLADVADVGTAVELVVVVGDVELHARVRDSRDLVVGQRCRVTIAPAAIAVWPAEPPAPSSLDEVPAAIAAAPVPDVELRKGAEVRRRRWSL